MRPQKLDTTLALKAIGLSPFLSGTDKRVICTILDHYNHRTGRCDPSLNTVAELLGVHRRTVMRTVARLVTLGLIEKVRHGGNSHRNAYIFEWARYRALEAKWKELRQARKARYGANLSPSRCPDGHSADDSPVTQTFPINNIQTTCHEETSTNKEEGLPKQISVTGQQNQRAGTAFHVKHVRSLDAQHAVAERRWNADLLALYRTAPGQYALIIEGVDEPTAQAATQLEIEQRGAGARFVIDELLKRGIRLTKSGSGAP